MYAKAKNWWSSYDNELCFPSLKVHTIHNESLNVDGRHLRESGNACCVYLSLDESR